MAAPTERERVLVWEGDATGGHVDVAVAASWVELEDGEVCSWR